MSLGSRISNRGKAAIASACLASSAPREPLLFLYPLWARKSSTSTQTPASPSQRKAHIRLPSPSQNDDNEHASAALSKRVYIRFKKTKKDGPTSEARGSRNAKSELVRFTTPKASVLRKLFSVRQSAEATALYNLRRRKAYQEARRIQRGADLPDWRVILATLLEHTPDAGRWLEKAVSILVPGNSAEELILGVDDNLWTIVYQHGCSIAFQSQEQETLDRRFLLSGPINGIVKTAGAILEVAPTVLIESTTNDFDIPAQISDMRTKSDPTQIVTAAEHANPILEAKENSRVRRSMVERRVKFLMTMNAAEVPRPEIWTVASFNDFVQYLTSAEMPNHLHRLMYDQRKDHIETVIEVLSSIFTDPKCRHAISRKAYNTAMQYFVKTNRIADARCLFVHMEIIKFPMDVETFNILLRGAAKNNDLSNFQLILNLMLRRNHTPNADTFVAFMRVFTDIRIKSYIVSAMDKKQLLNHKSALKEACECLVMDEIELSLQNNQTEEKFMAQMDSRYGPDWLTVASGNRIIHALGSRWLISRCWAFVMEMKARFIEPDNVSLNTILNHCKHMKNLEGAVEVIKNWPEDAQFGLPLDQMSYHALFEMAWRLRMHNVARVVWKYACLNVATTARMRTLVYNSVKVGVGLNMVPSRGLTRRIRSTSKPTQSELVAEGNEDYQRLLEAVAETMDQTSDNPPAVEAEKHPELSAELAVIEENTTMISSEIRLLSPSSTELNHFGHVSNPNNVAKMFNRTAGLFITGIDFFAIHPMECESLYLENTSSLPSSAFIPSNPPLFKRGKQHSTLYPRIAQAPSLGSIMASTLSTVHLAESQPVAEGTSNWSGFNKFEKISVVERQMERDRAVWQNWQPAKDFKEDLEDAYKRDMEWRELENFEDARSLDWMLERKVDVFVERRGSHQFIKRWS